jgi:hypothetical protein
VAAASEPVSKHVLKKRDDIKRCGSSPAFEIIELIFRELMMKRPFRKASGGRLAERHHDNDPMR